jgi:hypothetical protein
MKSDSENDPKPGARKTSAKKVAKTRETEASPKATVEQLTTRLSHSEQRLRELTDQCLGFLAELGEARHKQEDWKKLHERVDGLQELLVDSRRRLRSAGAEVLRPTAAAGTDSLEIVVWGGVPQAGPLASIVENMPGVSITCMLDSRKDEQPVDDSPDAVQWFKTTECNTPAQAFNTGLAATDGAAVLFLHAGSVPSVGNWSALPAADENSWAVQPGLTIDGDAAPGFFEGEDFQGPDVGDADEPVAVGSLDPRAFVVVRAAMEGIGAFDQDMIGPLTVAEYARRASDRGYRIVGWPDLCVDVAAAQLETDEDTMGRDRLLLLARHEPEGIGLALARAPFLWTMEPPVRAAFFEGLLERLPDALKWPEGRKITAAVIEGAIRATLSPEQFSEKFDPLLREKLDQLAAVNEVSVHDLWPELITEETTPSQMFQRVEALSNLEQNVRELLAAKLEGLTLDIEAVRADRDGAEKRVAVSAERVVSLEGSLASIADAINIMGEPHSGNVRERLTTMQADATRLTQLLDATNVPDPASLIKSLYDLWQQLAEREAWVVTLLRQTQKRRLSPFPRKLAQHEIDFITRVDGDTP